MAKAKHNLFKILGTLPLLAIVNCLSLAVDDVKANSNTEISIKTDSQGRVTGLSNLADPEILAGSTCSRQVNVRGVVTRINIGDDSSIVGIWFQRVGESGAFNHNISRTLKNTPQIRNFLTSGQPLDITYQPTGGPCRFLWIESIQIAETQNKSTISPSEFETYTDSRRFSIRYPQDWNLEKTSDRGHITIRNYEYSSSPQLTRMPQLIRVNVGIFPKSFQAAISARPRQPQNVIRRGTTNIGGSSGFEGISKTNGKGRLI
ncbi:MAG: hypothetical protein WCP16_18970, partial [Pseudanabaena sp. ELA645]